MDNSGERTRLVSQMLKFGFERLPDSPKGELRFRDVLYEDEVRLKDLQDAKNFADLIQKLRLESGRDLPSMVAKLAAAQQEADHRATHRDTHGDREGRDVECSPSRN